MSDPVPYQTPLPIGRNLRILDLPDGLRVSRDQVSSFALWREALVPAICVICLTGSAVFAVWNIGRRWQIDPQWILPAQIGVIGVTAMLLIWIIRDCSQNAGIVTDVAVTHAVVFWRKLNLWGAREYFWPLNTIVEVCYDPRNHSLRIHRLKGTALNAFAYFPKEELQQAALRLHNAVAKNRAAAV